ncbi:Glutathione import ATP-binding protein GsiA [Serratia proteamaculans]|uniref:ABC transporter ATP-binding protein n=1 Tax=Serratia proteamaculans TaxID=28151 RepID=A0ABS0TNA4_SERPR|nr:ABC transporter ATP-binding protein [Serratia proteamaculans]MBI6179811.1 ABC transporter ATP-binding protein [Serratia proteamaculans]RYM53312.1 ABC transporter ATP-binding protein [Serratia proteamaculans]CAI0728382.1 Glutathione import ATP-binding protein GsiA [Serratia proteamaculans]CAI0912950.1 Glutathione import ATP-binding protein GsiA [Serratia proteamaculans]CAI2044583.1 Glutathione import ATP-binding protein GsiA [Serratia proteamaculans]
MSIQTALQRAAATPVLELEQVSIAYQGATGSQRVVHQVSFAIQPGEVVALVGESGSGKTTTAQAIIGLLTENGRLEQGAIRLNGTDISHWSSRRLDAVRGAQISLIPQDPSSSLNPVKTIGEQVAEILNIHRRLPRKQVQQRVVALLTRVGLTHPELRARQYPHELSGGMKQRVLIAIAIALQPALIIADEPTSALDVTVQKRILDLIDELRQEFGTAVLLVTHDLAVAAERADRLLVFRHGRVQEQGVTAEVLRAPTSDYTRRLFADVPSLTRAALPQPHSSTQELAIQVNGLVKDFRLAGVGGKTYRALDQVSFSVPRGTTHALVGESGSGKTTLARCLLGFQRPDAGQIIIDGIDFTQLKGEALRQFRRRIQLVYQNPFGSLDPSQTLSQVIEEPLLNFEPLGKVERYRRVRELFERVALPDELLSRKPRELSGGQRQRVAIARALVLQPRVLVLDEATSALDVTVQAQILRLLQDLQQELGLTYLFISHDLARVRQISHSVSVLHRGLQVDSGATGELFAMPGSDYTRQLIEAIPGRQFYAEQPKIKDAINEQ